MVDVVKFKSRHEGSSYPSDRAELYDLFQELLEDAGDEWWKGRSVQGLIVPHIDFRVNLDLYASVYRWLMEGKRFPKYFVILGVGHQCPAEYSLCPVAYETPLGVAEPAVDLYQQVCEGAGGKISHFPETFEGEHSLEYVVVWLQVIRDLYFPGEEFQVLPVLMGGLHREVAFNRPPKENDGVMKFGRALQEVVTGEGAGDTCWIASIDGCHVGQRFDHWYSGNVVTQQVVKNWESGMWERCRSDRFKEFFGYLHEMRNCFYFDGVGVLTLMLQLFPICAVCRERELWYEDSDESFVTFSGGFFETL